jgi:hypothetical protein
VDPNGIKERWYQIVTRTTYPNGLADFVAREREIERLIAEVQADPDWEVIYQEVERTNIHVLFVHRHSSASFGVSYANTNGARYIQIISCPPR